MENDYYIMAGEIEYLRSQTITLARERIRTIDEITEMFYHFLMRSTTETQALIEFADYLKTLKETNQ